MNKTLKAVVAALFGSLVLAACSTVSTASDQVDLHYSAGSFSSTKYSDCVQSGNRKWNGPGDKYFNYPQGQRTYNFSNDKDADSAPITIVSKDNQELKVEGGLTFFLDTNCTHPFTINGHTYKGGILQAFHENIGLKFHAYMVGDDLPQGWQDLLNFYMGKPLKNAMQTAGQKFNWLDLYNNPVARNQFDAEVKAGLPESIKAQIGGVDYFQNFNLIIQKPEPDPRLVSSLAAVQQQVLQNKAVQQQNITVITELQQIRNLTKVLGPYGYILYKALQDCDAQNKGNSCPQFLPVPQGANINIGK